MKYLINFLILTLSVSAQAGVLYIGDSHSVIKTLTLEVEKQRFGNILIENLQSKGYEVSYYAACGATALDWAWGDFTSCGYTAYSEKTIQYAVTTSYPTFTNFFRRDRDTHLIVNLGDNMFNWKKVGTIKESVYNPEALRVNVDTFFAKLGPFAVSQCYWIGPTYHIEGSVYRKTNQAVDQLYSGLEKSLKNKCLLIDSRPLVIAREPNDGLHHISADSRKWGSEVLKKLKFN
jgi:hypothetical protein